MAKRLWLLSRISASMIEPFLIVGGGTMGSGIAYVAARGGYYVEIVEPDAGARERGVAYVAREAQRAGDASVLDRVRWLEAIPNSSDSGVAVEAVSERFDLKRDVLVALDRALSPNALIATNTSSLSVAELADLMTHPERLVGLHFFNPPARMQLLEIVAAPQSSDDAIERAYEVAARLDKTAVQTNDTPGFIVNRVARPFYLQALRAAQLGVASVDELDALARAAGFRMGPFELMDLIGLDVNLATSESIYARTQAERLAPVELQRQMVERGELGCKSGSGFYVYREGKAERFEPPIPSPQEELEPGEFVAIVGFGMRADELAELFEQRYRRVTRIENDDFLDEISPDVTVVIDAGDGATDRGDVIAALDALLGPETVLFVDAYATDVNASARRMRHPQRLVGYGILGAFEAQSLVEIVDSEAVSDDALELAQELFGAIGKGVILIEDRAGLFLGRTVAGIINEAMIAIAEEVASPEDIDTAMRLGASYPIGPIEWGREIGAARVSRILRLLADSEGEAFAPHRSLWMLDAPENPEPEQVSN